MVIRFGIDIDAIPEVSVIVGTLWEDLPEEKKEIFRAEARRLKEEHMVSSLASLILVPYFSQMWLTFRLVEW
jgi:hypothetical protein